MERPSICSIHTLDSLGYVHAQLGNHREATACNLEALTLLRMGGDRIGEAESLINLGDVYAATGDTNPARQLWSQAYVLLDELRHRASPRSTIG